MAEFETRRTFQEDAARATQQILEQRATPPTAQQKRRELFETKDEPSKTQNANQQHSQHLAAATTKPTKSSSFFSSPALMVTRVFQLDGERMNNEVINLLHKMITEAVQPLNVSFATQYHDEISLGLGLLFYRLGIWTNCQSYGDKLQNLVYRDEALATQGVPSALAQSLRASPATAPSKSKRALHCFLMAILPYILTKIQRKILDEGWFQGGDGHALDNIGAIQEAGGGEAGGGSSWSDILSTPTKRFLASSLTFLEKVYYSCELVNFTLFLLHGDYRSPIDRLLRMRLVYGNQRMHRMTHIEYLNQQVFWSVMFSFLSFALPLLNLGWLWSWFSSRAKDNNAASSPTSPFHPSPTSTVGAPGDGHRCGFCHTSPIASPKRALPCRHIACYYCLAGRLKQDSEVLCSVCQEKVTEWCDL